MIAMFIGTDRSELAVNPTQVTFISSVTEGTRVRFGEGRSVTVTEPIAEVVETLNRSLRPHE